MTTYWKALLIGLLTLSLSAGPVLAYEDQEQATREPKGEEMVAEFRGSYTVAVTPFTEDGSAIDVPGLKKFLDWQIDVEVPGTGSVSVYLSIRSLASA